MTAYIRRHEKDILRKLATNPPKEAIGELLTYHNKQIAWLQHERLAHLITMLFVCLFFLLALGFTLDHFSLPALILTVLLLVLSTAYVFHYYRLENTVRRWYSISNRMRSKLQEG
ncbi:MAG: hypothetical protein NTW38_01470 [Candidatus Aminicenantes bacterium]|nr:hypothetical protein [Candidatus Aminicenantes bacterium]